MKPFITLGVVLAVVTLSNFVTAEVGVSDSVTSNAHPQLLEDRELTNCDCSQIHCYSSYKYHGYGKYLNKCYSVCCAAGKFQKINFLKSMKFLFTNEAC